jgi:Ca-activated chloride channel family protein
MKKVLFLLLTLCIVFQSYGQSPENQPPIIFIYDASGSMWGQMQGKTKMEIAASVLSDAVNNLSENQKLGFVAYGHRKEGDCRDIEFMVNSDDGSKAEVIQAVKGIKPLGKTPLAYSASLVIDKLRKSKQKATIILITDGIESCDGEICEIVKASKSEGIDFKLHIIGFGLKDEDTSQLRCAAEAGEGNYFNAQNAESLGEILNVATTSTVNKPANNFSVYALKNGLPVDAYVKAYDVVAKREPIMLRTYQDTGYFYLPPSKYNLEVIPLEGSDVDMITIADVESFENKMGHQTISFDGGKLGIHTTNNGNNWDCLVKIIDANGKVVAGTRTYDSKKELEVNSGLYKVSVQALNMKGIHTFTTIDSVQISAGKVTPLIYEFKTGNFEIFTKAGSENIDTIVSIKEINSGKNVAGSRTYARGASFILNPDTYEVKVIPLGVNKDKASQTFTMDVKQGETTTKELIF